jgi:hypothetical protein
MEGANMKATIMLVVAVLSCAATADELPIRSTNDVEVVFASLDRDHDRKISRNEAQVKGSVRKRFDGIDSDGDGYLKTSLGQTPDRAPAV